MRHVTDDERRARLAVRHAMARHWLGDDLPVLTAGAGYHELARLWLQRFGAGIEADLVWWLGTTKSAVRTAPGELGVVAVSLDGGGSGWLLPDDTDEVAIPDPRVALLPVLDPPAMRIAGWS